MRILFHVYLGRLQFDLDLDWEHRPRLVPRFTLSRGPNHWAWLASWLGLSNRCQWVYA